MGAEPSLRPTRVLRETSAHMVASEISEMTTPLTVVSGLRPENTLTRAVANRPSASS